MKNTDEYRVGDRVTVPLSTFVRGHATVIEVESNGLDLRLTSVELIRPYDMFMGSEYLDSVKRA